MTHNWDYFAPFKLTEPHDNDGFPGAGIEPRPLASVPRMGHNVGFSKSQNFEFFPPGIRIFAPRRVRPEGARTEGRGLHKGLRLAHPDGKGEPGAGAEAQDDELASV